MHSVTLNMNEIQSILNVKSEHIIKAKKEFLRIMKDASITNQFENAPHPESLIELLFANNNIEDYIEIFAENMNLQEEVISIAKTIYTHLKDHIKEYKPFSKAASCIYFAIEHFTILKGVSNASDKKINKKLTVTWITKEIFPLLKEHCDTSYATIRNIINATSHIIDEVIITSTIYWYAKQVNKYCNTSEQVMQKVGVIIQRLMKQKNEDTSIYCIISTTLLTLAYLFNNNLQEATIYAITKTTFNDVRPYLECIIPYTNSIFKEIC